MVIAGERAGRRRRGDAAWGRAGSTPGAAGFTVVEIMVTLVVASLVAASTFMFFIGQQRIYETQTRILNLQQNIWAAMETVNRFVRAAGAGMGGCVQDPDPDGAGGVNHEPVTRMPANVAPATGLRAFRAFSSPQPLPAVPGPAVFRIPPIWIENNVDLDPATGNASDRLTVAFGLATNGNFGETQITAAVATDTSTGSISVTANTAGIFQQNDFVLLVDGGGATADRGCTLFQVMQPPGASTLNVTGGNWNPPVGGTAGLTRPGGYTVGAPTWVRHFGTLMWVRFFIQRPAGRPPQLMMRRLDLNPNPGDQVLAEGIEDLQVAYACDRLPVGAPDGVLTEGGGGDEWVLNQPGEHGTLTQPPPDCTRPQAIRLTLVARTTTEDSMLTALGGAGGAFGNGRPAAEDNPAAPTGDGFRRRVYTTTVFPRNR